MNSPFDKYLAACEKGRLVPVWIDLPADMYTPTFAYRILGENSPGSFLLESVVDGMHIGRHSYLGINPFMVIKSRGRNVSITKNGKEEMFRLMDGEDPLHVLERTMRELEFAPIPDLPPFVGGAVGYIGYDTARFWANLPEPKSDGRNLPDVYQTFCRCLIAFDHLTQRMKVIWFTNPGDNPHKSYAEGIEKAQEVIARLEARRAVKIKETTALTVPFNQRVREETGKKQYLRMVEAAKRHILDGDIMQAVLSLRKWVSTHASPFNVFRALRSINPSPYMFYLNMEKGLQIVGASPEILVTVDGDTVITRPLAGTIRRGATEEEDAQLAQILLADQKEISEHCMLIDLARNDLGAVCRTGSIVIDEKYKVERYSHVQHIVSQIRGRLAEGMNAFDAIRATFPAGTLSGAPKIMAMKIISQLEEIGRGPYGGIVCYAGYTGTMTTGIILRTIVVKDGIAYVQSGAGIVHGSVPENEYQETCMKAAAMLKAIELAEEYS